MWTISHATVNPKSVLYKSCTYPIGDDKRHYIYACLTTDTCLHISINYEEFYAHTYYDFDKPVNQLPTADDLIFTCEENRYKWKLDKMFTTLQNQFDMHKFESIDEFKNAINSVITIIPDEYKERLNLDDLGPKYANKL